MSRARPRRLLALVLLLATAGRAGAQSGTGTGNAGGTGGTTVTVPTTGPMIPEPGTIDATSGRNQAGKPGLGTPPSWGGVTLSGAVDPSLYRVGPGDVLLLEMWGKVSRNLSLEVGPEGRILVPGSGTLKVEGNTLKEVREALLGLMREQFRDVSMDVRLARPRVFRVYLAGQVRVPGVALATGSNRVADVLAPGAMLDNASTRRIDVLHRDGRREIADLGLFYATGTSTFNPMLEDGDVVSVPVATEFIHVQGAVAKPGDYELGPRDSLSTLLRLAGDPIPGAFLDHALVIRWRDPFRPESLWVNIEEVYAGRTDPPLHEGERLYVYYVPQYHIQHEASVAGQVQRPGTFPIVEGRTRLSDLVGYAGGFLPDADLSSIHVHRRNAAAGEKDPELDRLLRLSRTELTNTEYVVLQTKLSSLREDYRVDWSRLKSDPAKLDLLLRDGDVVRVERLVSSVRVDGQVRRPGIITYQPGLSMNDYVEQAGGFTDHAWVGKTRVTRAANGQVLPARNVHQVDPGDFIWVPEKPDVTAWEQATMVLTPLAYLATIVIAFHTVR